MSTFPSVAWPGKPLREEKMTTKEVVAFLESNPGHTSTGTMKFPPPIPRSPSISPAAPHSQSRECREAPPFCTVHSSLLQVLHTAHTFSHRSMFVSIADFSGRPVDIRNINEFVLASCNCHLKAFAFKKAPLLTSARASQGDRALYTTINARTITNIESPSSSQNGFVFNDLLLPIKTPIIDPISTNTAGNQLILPRFQYTNSRESSENSHE
jgi:hypothetical protein